MRRALLALALTILAGALAAQDGKTSAETREAKHRLGLVATRAIATFHSMDSVAENLDDLGVALHPDLVSLRSRLESSLDTAEAAIEHNDLKKANEALTQA